MNSNSAAGAKPILFLDIDGVLNDHTWHQPADSTTIDKPCMDRLNKIIAETGCQIVLSTAWRYMIHNKAMAPIGFYQMLRTHGLDKKAEIIGLTHPDEVSRDGYTPADGFAHPQSTRGFQIKNWVEKFGKNRHYVIVDDNDFEISQLHGTAFVQTQSDIGMTDDDMNRIIEKLKS